MVQPRAPLAPFHHVVLSFPRIAQRDKKGRNESTVMAHAIRTPFPGKHLLGMLLLMLLLPTLRTGDRVF